MNVYEKITALVPGVHLEEGATPTLYVEPASLHEVAIEATLKSTIIVLFITRNDF